MQQGKRLLKQFNTKDQRGVVALLTSVVVGLLLIIVTTGAIAVSVGELRQASDYDNSIKAYYAAESGAEDAVATIRRGLTRPSGAYSINALAKNNCPAYASPYETSYLDNIDQDGSVIIDETGNLKYTCQIVRIEQNELTGTLAAEEVTQINLTGASFDQLRLSWNLRGSSVDPQNYTKSALPVNFPVGTNWQNIYPAVMEMTVISYPTSGNFQSCQVRSITAVLKPTNTSNATLSIPSLGASDCATPNSSIATPVLVNCDPANPLAGYDCRVTVSGFNTAANNYIVKLTPRYSPASYKLEALSGGSNVTIPNAQLVLDVTGRSGDITRRVLLQAPLGGQTAVPGVLLANESICKLLTVSTADGTASPVTGCE